MAVVAAEDKIGTRLLTDCDKTVKFYIVVIITYAVQRNLYLQRENYVCAASCDHSQSNIVIYYVFSYPLIL